jgi:hypothetical protein
VFRLKCSVAHNGYSTKKKKRRAGKRRAAVPPTVNGDDFNGK